MASRGDPGSSVDWRESIVLQFQNRNRQQCSCFQDLITSNTQLFDNVTSLRHENLQLSIQNEQLRMELRAGGGGTSSTNVAALESKLLAQQEELTELHRKRGENAQMLVDLNKKLQEREKLLVSKDESLAESIAINTTLRAEIQLYKISKTELESLNQFLRDEHQALQLAFTHLEEKLRKVQEENREMVERLMKYKSKDAEKLNEENENFVRKRQSMLQKELEDAARDMRGLSPDSLPSDSRPMCASSAVPTTAVIVFDAHDGEVSAVRWSPVDRILATGGADRKVKLWNISKGNVESKGMLVGSNYTVMSVEFDSTGSLILGSSNDFATRVWTVSDQRLRHTLTGHGAKVMAAKFLGDQTKVVTGSHDRTLKIWDLRSRSCVDTKFPGSSCNDVVVSDSTGTTIISGHFDKKIRFWDLRSENVIDSIEVEGKVTSLDLSRNNKTLISCVRDDTLRMIDLRMNQIIATFRADGFKVGCDWTRAMFNSDGEHVAVGSNDGGIYIWNTVSLQLLPVLLEHKCLVQAVAWHPYANWLASVDRSKKAIIWSDA